MTEHRDPYSDADELPVPEVGDLGSFQEEPDHGDPEAPEPELEPERLDASVVDLELQLATEEPWRSGLLRPRTSS